MTNSGTANRKERVSAVVLAAGSSRRMGTVKQLLKVGNSTLLETVLNNLKRTNVSEIIVVLGSSESDIRKQVSLDDVQVAVNESYEQGMGTSVRAGITAIDPESDAVLVVLADQPYVRPETIDSLINQYCSRKPGIVVPVYEGFRGNPVLLDRSLFLELLQLTGDIGCRAIFRNHTEDLMKVPVNDIGVLLDIDTQADLERFGTTPIRPEMLQSVDLEGRADRPELIVVGDDKVAQALAQFGNALDFKVSLVDPVLQLTDVPGATRILHVLDLTRLHNDSGMYVVVASRGRFDEDAVEQALNANADYVALVANEKRACEVKNRLHRNGLSNQKLDTLRAPAGFPIGAKSPAEIALSIMAEIVSQRSRASREAVADHTP